jgi:phosphoglycerate dehydrogenase-like enzyme
MIGEPQFRLMKPSTILLNTARGPIVSQRALEQALEQRSILGAGLDVLENEPSGVDLAARFSNCIMTPHSAFYSQESVLEMRRTSALIVREALVHGKLQNVVNQVRDSDVVPV